MLKTHLKLSTSPIKLLLALGIILIAMNSYAKGGGSAGVQALHLSNSPLLNLDLGETCHSCSGEYEKLVEILGADEGFFTVPMSIRMNIFATADGMIFEGYLYTPPQAIISSYNLAKSVPIPINGPIKYDPIEERFIEAQFSFNPLNNKPEVFISMSQVNIPPKLISGLLLDKALPSTTAAADEEIYGKQSIFIRVGSEPKKNNLGTANMLLYKLN